MHKQMNEIVAKDWSKMQAYLDWNKEQYKHSIKAMQAHPEYDFQKMFMDDPNLFVFFMRIHEDPAAKYDIEKFWNLYYEAYQHLKKDGLFNIDMTPQKVELMKAFKNKLAGPCLVSKEELEDTMTAKKKRGETSVHFDYHEVLDLITNKYDISERGFFDVLKYETEKSIFAKYFSLDIYDQVSRTSPVDSLEANYMSIINDAIGDQFEHIDFWHYLLDSDFGDISNGSISSMWPVEDDEEEVAIKDIINTKKPFQRYFSRKVKQAFFKELEQLDEVDPNDGIEFLIEW